MYLIVFTQNLCIKLDEKKFTVCSLLLTWGTAPTSILHSCGENEGSMRYVMIPDDVDPSIYSLIPSLLLTGLTVAVWRPSFQHLRDLHSTGKLFYGPKDFLDLVESGHVVAVGRDDWYKNAHYRSQNPDWARDCPWDSSFDGELSRIARTDESSPLPLRRAIVAPAPTGPSWAKKYADAEGEHLRYAIEMLRKKKLPDRILRKVLSAENERDQAVRLLSLCRNVVSAYQEADADVPVISSVQSFEIDALGLRRKSGLKKGSLPDNDSVLEAAEAIGELRSFKNYAEFKAFLNSPKRDSVLRGVAPLLSDRGVVEQMRKSAANPDLDLSWREALKISPYQMRIAVLGSLLDFATSGGVLTGAVLGSGLAFATAPSRLPEKIGWSPISSGSAKEVAWLSQLINRNQKSDKLKLKDIRMIRKALERLRS